MDTRQEVKHKLSMAIREVDLAPLEKKLRELSVVSLNQKVRIYADFLISSVFNL